MTIALENGPSVRARLDDVKLRTVVENVFFGTFTYLPLQVSKRVPTAGTNGKKFVFNPDFVLKQSERTLYGLYLHEVCHVALGHHLRRGDRDPKVWNIAADYSINQILNDYGVVLPEGALLNSKYAGMSAEQIYAKIIERGGPNSHEVEEGLKGRVDDIPSKDKPRRKKQQQDKTKGKPSKDKDAEKGEGEDGEDAEAGDDEGDEDAPEGIGDPGDDGKPGKPDKSKSGKGSSTSNKSEDDESEDEDEGDGEGDDEGDEDEGEDEDDDPTYDEDPYDTDPDEDEDEDEEGEVLERSDELKSFSEEVADWTVKVCQAEALARGAGELPDSLTQEINSQKQSKAPWTAILADILSRITEDDFSYAKPNKLFSHSNIIHPGVYSEELGKIVIAVDTSGSTWDQKIMDKLAGEVENILSQFNFDEVHVISCDSRIQHVDVLYNGDPLEFKPYGGGGTDVVPVFRYIEEKQLDPAALIYLTDLDFYRYPATEPSYKVIWGAVNASKWYKQRVPFGTVIDIDTYA